MKREKQPNKTEAKNVIKTPFKEKTVNLINKIDYRLIVVLIFLVINVNAANFTDNDTLIRQVELIQKDINQDFILNIRIDANNELIKHVQLFINKSAPNNKLSAEKLVDVCNNYNLDVVFVLAQGLLESHYGTKGKAGTTNSVFNVGTYDDGQILYRYKHPDDSLEPYAKLLVKRYLVDKDIEELLKDKGYTNVYGQRFASAKKYEAGLRRLISKIEIETEISMYQEIVNMDDSSILAFFGPRDMENNYDYELYTMN